MSLLVSERNLSLFFLVILVGVWIDPLYVLFRLPDRTNVEYRAEDFDKLRQVAQEIIQADIHGSSVIAARKGYVTHFAGRKRIPTPYADYQALVRYLSLNDVKFLVVEHRMLRHYPFMRMFSEANKPREFILLYSTMDSWGDKLELYRFAGERQR